MCVWNFCAHLVIKLHNEEYFERMEYGKSDYEKMIKAESSLTRREIRDRFFSKQHFYDFHFERFPNKIQRFDVLNVQYHPIPKSIDAKYIPETFTATMKLCIDGKESIFTGTKIELQDQLRKKIKSYKRYFL